MLQSLGITEPGDIDLEAIAAHELGHWHHHRGRAVCQPDDIGDQRRDLFDPERVADSYAADLLMPPEKRCRVGGFRLSTVMMARSPNPKIRASHPSSGRYLITAPCRYLFALRANTLGGTTYGAVESLATEFRTSKTATAIRLVEIGPEPAMLVCHGPDGRKWFNRPDNIPKRWFPREELDAESYALGVLHGNDRHTRRVLIGADAWFDRWGADRYELYEQTFKVAVDEILSLLVFKDDEMLD